MLSCWSFIFCGSSRCFWPPGEVRWPPRLLLFFWMRPNFFFFFEHLAGFHNSRPPPDHTALWWHCVLHVFRSSFCSSSSTLSLSLTSCSLRCEWAWIEENIEICISRPWHSDHVRPTELNNPGRLSTPRCYTFLTNHNPFDPPLSLFIPSASHVPRSLLPSTSSPRLAYCFVFFPPLCIFPSLATASINF